MVHDDVYKIIKYTVQKTMTGELAQRALDWWAGLVEHLFGLPERTPEQEKAVVPAAEDHSTRNKVNSWSGPWTANYDCLMKWHLTATHWMLAIHTAPGLEGGHSSKRSFACDFPHIHICSCVQHILATPVLDGCH